MESDKAQLDDVFNGEKDLLYDFIFRMTGDQRRSANSISEVYEAIKSEETLDQPQLKGLLYQTARSFNRDIWNQFTPNLPLATDHPDNRFFNGLEPLQKEVLLLKFRIHLEDEKITNILGLSAARFQQIIDSIHEKIRLQYASTPEAFCQSLPMMAMPPMEEDDEALAISEIIEQVKRTREKPLPWMEYLYWFMLIGFAIIVIFFRNQS